jgi:hypothetical protein
MQMTCSMKYFGLFAVLSLALVAGCRKDPVPPVDPGPQTLNLSVRAAYDGDDLERYKDYVFDSGRLQFVDYTVYLSDITLLRGAEEVLLSEIEYVDFFPVDLTSNVSAKGELSFDSLPAGAYTGIRLGFGVKPALNARKPSNFRPGDVLYNDIEYWASWKSYIFSRLDASFDREADGNFETLVAYHCGGDDVYKVFTYEHSFAVDADHRNVELTIDVKKLLSEADGTLYDVATHPTTSHSVANLVVADAIMSHYAHAVTVRQ